MGSDSIEKRPVEVTTWYLELRDRVEFTPSARPDPAPEMVHVAMPSPALNRSLYERVGGPWHWTDKLSWTEQQWLAYVDRPALQTWVMRVDAQIAGYVELEKNGDDVQIAYFGLVPEFIGRGLGGFLLSVAIGKAWELGAARVWVHTCSLDHPAALANYKARGMKVYRKESRLASASSNVGD